MLRRAQRVLYVFGAIGVLSGVGLALGADGSLGAWIGATASLAFGLLMACISVQAPRRNLVIRALVDGRPKLSGVTLFPSAHVHAPPEQAEAVLLGLSYSVVFALGEETVPGEYRLRRDEAPAFVDQLRAHDPAIVIEVSDAQGDRYRVTDGDELR